MLEIDGLFIIILADLIGFIRNPYDILLRQMKKLIDEICACSHFGILLHKTQHSCPRQHLTLHSPFLLLSKDFAFIEIDISE